MGFLQPYVRYSGGYGETRLTPVAGKAVTVISLKQAKAALAAALALDVPVVLISAPGASAYVGAGWFDALVSIAKAAYPNADFKAVLDCGDAPGHALAALRHGFKAIRYEGASQRQIEDIAAQSGATVLRERPDALELTEADDPAVSEAICRSWLGVINK